MIERHYRSRRDHIAAEPGRYREGRYEIKAMSSSSKPSKRHRSRDRTNVNHRSVEAAATTAKHAKSGSKNISKTTPEAKVRGRTLSPAPRKHLLLPQDNLIFKSLPCEYLPKKDNDRRLIVIGDVHGMYNALQALLRDVSYNRMTDHLVFVGDLVTRGKDENGSLNVLDYAITEMASVVRGNHEDKLLNVEVMERNKKWVEDTSNHPKDFIRHDHKLRTPKDDEKILYETLGEKADGLIENREKDLGRKEPSTKELIHKRMDFIKNMPHLLDLGAVGGCNRMVVAHAGINPYRSFKRQHPTVVMNVKSVNPGLQTCSWLGKLDKERNTLLDEKGKKLSDKAKGPMDPWYEEWNNIQENLDEKERTAIIYGHNAKEGWQKRKYSFGLDTGVHRSYYTKEGKKTRMGMLTALIINATSCKPVQAKEHESGRWELKFRAWK